MRYRVEELAAAAGVGVDTVRFYQSKGLLDPPEREGRVAWYAEAHLERLRRIRALKDQGLKLSTVRRLLAADPPDGIDTELLRAVVDASGGPQRTLTRDALAREAGVPVGLIQAIQAAGLIEPVHVGGEERFSEDDLEMARVGLAILEAGFPIHEVMSLAVRHAAATRDIVDAAIDLFDAHVRKPRQGVPEPEQVTRVFRLLHRLTTRLVALHFQRTLVRRALERLEARAEQDDLDHALRALEEAELAVEVSWRDARGARSGATPPRRGGRRERNPATPDR